MASKDKKTQPALIQGGREALHEQTMRCFFEGACLGNEDAMNRFHELVKRLEHRGELRTVSPDFDAPGSTPKTCRDE